MADTNSTTVFKKCGHERMPENVYTDKRGYGSCKTCRRIEHAEFVSANPLYAAWQKMIERCTNPNNPSWSYYGGRGIAVCGRWLTSYAAFVADMGPKPTPAHSVDRRDNSLGYNPSNCYWATSRQQGRNKRVNRFMTHNGQTLLLVEWAEIEGLSYRVIYDRLRLGWSDEEALTMPLGTRRLADGSFNAHRVDLSSSSDIPANS